MEKRFSSLLLLWVQEIGIPGYIETVIYSYSYWLHLLSLCAWMLFFDTCPCLDCCLVLDLACIASTLNITSTFSVAGLILGILYF